MKKFKIKHPIISDLETIMNIYESARAFMKESGNPNQWADRWPTKEIVIEDIQFNRNFVVTYDNEIVAVFAFIIGEDPTYLKIESGNWISNERYGAIHRIASSFKFHGLFGFIQKELESMFDCNFRIDTHKDNIIMQKLINKAGYKYCGIITIADGGKRLAYEKVIKKSTD